MMEQSIVLNMNGQANNTGDNDVTAADGESGSGSARSDVTDVVSHPFRQSNETSDLRLIVERKPLYVSRVVLSLISPVFKRMLRAQPGVETVELPLAGKNYTDMVTFLGCIYPDILTPITDANVEAMLKLADEFQVRRLLEKCEDFLTNDVTDEDQASHPEKVVRYLNLSDKYGLCRLQKAAFETAAKTPSDSLENVRDFWVLPAVTTTSLFIRRLKLLEQHGKNIRAKTKEFQNHCALYHKGDRPNDSLCSKCFASFGKYAKTELNYF